MSVSSRPRIRAQALHPWRVSYKEAIAIQERLRRRVRLVPLPRRVRLVAGTDVAYSAATHHMYAAVVVVSLPSLERIDSAEAVVPARFPYIPGLFTFREAPPLLEAFRRLRTEPDAVLFDGHGLAHPRRFGLACHAGLLLGTPSVGCAKSLLVGRHDDVGLDRGAWTGIVDQGETIGAAVRTRTGISPVFVSPGHLADLRSSIDLVLAATGRYRLPEPIRLAHLATGSLQRRLDTRLRPPRVRRYANFVAAHASRV